MNNLWLISLLIRVNEWNCEAVVEHDFTEELLVKRMFLDPETRRLISDVKSMIKISVCKVNAF